MLSPCLDRVRNLKESAAKACHPPRVFDYYPPSRPSWSGQKCRPLVTWVGHLGQEGGQCLTSKRTRQCFGGVGLRVADVIDRHWLQKAAMDHQRAALAVIDLGARSPAIGVMTVGDHSKEK